MSIRDSMPRAERRIGAVLNDPWRLTKVLGQGATAWVYMAEDTRGEVEGGLAAVKILHSEWVDEPAVRARFVREARVTQQIDHPGVVRIYDEGEFKAAPFLAMELL